MKCPHCAVGIHEAFGEGVLITEPPINSSDGKLFAPGGIWKYFHLRCPECSKAVLYLQQHISGFGAMKRFLAYPQGYARPLAVEVVDPYRTDFIEACKVLNDSPKASAALSRRCVQMILVDKANAKKKDFYDQIEEVITSGQVPSHIVTELHAVRNIGNIAAHGAKSINTGQIVDVEPGEAEWNLDVLESLFDFYFVQPALSAQRLASLQTKLDEIGKKTKL
jgi:hypothetical protein